jgi:GTP cyclohydrolase I
MITAATNLIPVNGPARPGASDGRSVDLGRIELAVRQILIAVGEDPDRDGLTDTPRRVARAYAELFRGLRETPGPHLTRVFDCPSVDGGDDVILVRDIEFFSVCEHHLLPFSGMVHIAYLPGERGIVGLSKLARTVEVFARRPQVQERLTHEIADAIERHLSPRAAAVVVEAEHFCMKMRGVNKSGSRMVTSTLRGSFREDRAVGSEVLNLIFNSSR